MSIPQPPRPAKLVIGLLLGRKDPFPLLAAELEAAAEARFQAVQVRRDPSAGGLFEPSILTFDELPI